MELERWPEVNVKVILDSEEEKGSPSIGKVMQAHHELLRSDAIVIHDGPMHSTNRPTLVFGNRGAADARLTVYGDCREGNSVLFAERVRRAAGRFRRPGNRRSLTRTYSRKAGCLRRCWAMSGCPNTKPVDEGIDAYCQGVPRSACPYAPGTPEHRDWLYGWDEAEALDFEEYGERH